MSTTVSFLRSQLKEAEQAVSESRKALRAEDDFVTQAALASAEAMRNDIRSSLRSATASRGVEVLRLHLEGKEAKNGALPLHTVAQISDKLYRGLYSAAAFVKSGEVVKRIPKKLVEALNFKLADLQPGSTELIISGDINADLFGNSLAEQTFDSTISLLRSTESGSLDEAISQVGPAAVRQLRELLDVIHKRDLSVEIKWTDSDLETHRWEATPVKIERASQALAIRREGAEEVSLVAYVEGLNLRGRIELRPLGPEGEPYKPNGQPYHRLMYVTYSLDTAESVRSLNLGDIVDATVLQTQYRNSITGRVQQTNILRSVSLLSRRE